VFKNLAINQLKVLTSKATRGKGTSHTPTPPLGAANHASRSDVGLGSCENMARNCLDRVKGLG